MEQLVAFRGNIPRKHRRQFEVFLNHSNERVRAVAEELEASMAFDHVYERALDEVNDVVAGLCQYQRLEAADSYCMEVFSDGEEW